MSDTVLYHVEFVPRVDEKWHRPGKRFVVTVRAVEDSSAFRGYHLHNGKHLTPDYAAIRDALPHYLRKAFDRISSWWFPVTLHSELGGRLDDLNACTAIMYDSKGKFLGRMYATPYLYGGRTTDGNS